MKAKTWKSLKPGDIVDVVSPGYASKPEEIEACRKFLISWGLIPRIPAGLVAPHFLHSNDDVSRFKFLKNALLAQDSAAVWCLRGGYGSNRLLPMLSKLKAPLQRKLFVGISDITSLHVFLTQEWRWSCVHGPLLDRLGRGAISSRHMSEMKKMVFGESEELLFPRLKPMNELAKKTTRLEAPIIGGNLVVLQSMIGTPWEPDLRGKFLFLEEIAERGYRVDRILEHFAQAGLWKGCRGVLLGDFIKSEEADGRDLVPPVIKRWAATVSFPVFSGIPAGHAEIQRPIPFGPMATISRPRSGATENQRDGFKMSVPTGKAKR